MFLIIFLLGTKPVHKRPLVKILKVEDLKNDDIVERIKRELGQQLSFKLDSSATKLLGPSDLNKKSSEELKSSKGSTVISTAYTMTTGNCPKSSTEYMKSSNKRTKCFVENTQNSLNHTKNSTDLTKSSTEDSDEGPKKIKVDPDSKEPMKPPEKGSSYIVLNRKVHLERMKRFISMNKSDIPVKRERKFKCEAPLNELKTPVDTIRCSKCGVLYESDILVAHLKTCQGDKRKTKYGCRLCSFTDCDFRQLEAHIKAVHPKRFKKKNL